MAYTKKDDIYKINTDNKTQLLICSHFSERVTSMLANKEEIKFDGSYKPEDDDILYIDNFQLTEDILDAIHTPIGVQSADGNLGDIKYIFIGEKIDNKSSEEFHIAFKKLRHEQYISTSKLSIFFSNNTFKREKRLGLIINDIVDCFYSTNKLFFYPIFCTSNF